MIFLKTVLLIVGVMLIIEGQKSKNVLVGMCGGALLGFFASLT